MKRLILVSSLLVLLLLVNNSSQVDLTLEPKTKGYDVTQSVLRKIYRSGIFEDDYFFLHRVAHIATKFGEDDKTYEEESMFRGIWQLTQSEFNETLTNPNLTDFRYQIGEKFQEEIGNWSLVTWDDLLKPLHNGLAFRLHIQQYFAPSDVSANLAPWPLLIDQAEFYTSNLNSSADIQSFINDTLLFEAEPECQTEMDIVFVQDGSCTVNNDNMTDIREFISGLVNVFTFSNIRVGYVIYSVDILPIFNLDNGFTQNELENAILTAARPTSQYTFTASGIAEGLQILDTPSVKREGVPKVLVLLTDGESIQYLDDVTNATLEAGLDTFAIGLSLGWSQDQLLPIAHNDPNRVFKSRYTFSLAHEFIYRTSIEICSVAHRLSLNTSTFGTSGRYGKMNYKFNFDETTENGVNVTLNVSRGQIRVFYSYSEQTPNSALHDGQLLTNGVVYFIPKLNEAHYLFVAVEGLDVYNYFDILVT